MQRLGIYASPSVLASSLVLSSAPDAFVPVNVSNAYAQLFHIDPNKVFFVAVGFAGADSYFLVRNPEDVFGGTFGGAFLAQNRVNETTFWPLGGGPLSAETIFFPTGGTYYPEMVIRFDNGTSIVKTYSEYPVQVVSSSEISFEQVERLNLALSVALVVFASVEILNIARDWSKP